MLVVENKGRSVKHRKANVFAFEDELEVLRATYSRVSGRCGERRKMMVMRTTFMSVRFPPEHCAGSPLPVRTDGRSHTSKPERDHRRWRLIKGTLTQCNINSAFSIINS